MSQSTEPTQAELVIIGAGPGGYPAAFHAADIGMKVTLIDKAAAPGGVCLYRGCIPSKAFLHAAAIIRDAREAEAIGITFGEPTLDLDKVRNWKQGIVDKLTTRQGWHHRIIEPRAPRRLPHPVIRTCNTKCRPSAHPGITKYRPLNKATDLDLSNASTPVEAQRVITPITSYPQIVTLKYIRRDIPRKRTITHQHHTHVIQITGLKITVALVST